MTDREFYALTDQDVDRANLAVDPAWAMETPAEPHSWQPIDLAAAEGDPPSPPTINGIVYPGRVHVWSGEPETLKSLVAMAVALAEIRAGHTIVYIDLENGVRETTSRLRALGASTDELARFLYINPTQALESDIRDDTLKLLHQHTPSVAFVDSYTGSLAIHRCDPNSAIDVERHHQEVVNSLRTHDAAVVLLDHLPKNRDNRGRFSIGSERKIGVCDIHLGFELILPLSRGHKGVVKLVTHKDRPGYLHRPKAAQAKFESTPEGDLTWTLEPAEDDPAAVVQEFRPTILMERVSTYLALHQDRPTSMNEIEEAVLGKREYIRKAVDALVREGYCAESKGARGARQIDHVTDYRELSDQTKIDADLAPTSPRPKTPDLAPTSPRTIPLNHAVSATSPHLAPTSPLAPESTSPQDPSPPQGGRAWRGEVSEVQKRTFNGTDPDSQNGRWDTEPEPDNPAGWLE